MTSLKRQMDRALSMLADIRDKLQNSQGHPPCCLTFYKDSRISCDVTGPMPEKAFSTHCKRCRNSMKELLDCISKSLE